MTHETITRILASYEQFAPALDAMVAGFYKRVFAASPETRTLFKSDMAIQRRHLGATLALLVRNLPFQDLLEEPFMDLGAQHIGFGARPEHYPVIRDALLGSIGEALGPHWEGVREDWTALIDHVIAVMVKGATLFELKAAVALRRRPGS